MEGVNMKLRQINGEFSAADELLARHKVAIGEEINRFFNIYINEHPINRSGSTARLFINKYKAQYQDRVNMITADFLKQSVSQPIGDRADFLERIMVQDRKAIADFVERITE